jgi:hypothetical protein
LRRAAISSSGADQPFLPWSLFEPSIDEAPAGETTDQERLSVANSETIRLLPRVELPMV